MFIERDSILPRNLMRRAWPEIDDAGIEELKKTSRKAQDDAEDKLFKQFIPSVIPALKRIPDH